MPERVSAVEAPFIARMSGSFCASAEIARQMTWTSLRKPSGKSGRMGRSISRHVRVSFWRGSASPRKIPPGAPPAGVQPRAFLARGGKEVVGSLRGLRGHRGGEPHGAAVADDDGSVGLFGTLAGLEGERPAVDHRDR